MTIGTLCAASAADVSVCVGLLGRLLFYQCARELRCGTACICILLLSARGSFSVSVR